MTRSSELTPVSIEVDLGMHMFPLVLVTFVFSFLLLYTLLEGHPQKRGKYAVALLGLSTAVLLIPGLISDERAYDRWWGSPERAPALTLLQELSSNETAPFTKSELWELTEERQVKKDGWIFQGVEDQGAFDVYALRATEGSLTRFATTTGTPEAVVLILLTLMLALVLAIFVLVMCRNSASEPSVGAALLLAGMVVPLPLVVFSHGVYSDWAEARDEYVHFSSVASATDPNFDRELLSDLRKNGVAESSGGTWRMYEKKGNLLHWEPTPPPAEEFTSLSPELEESLAEVPLADLERYLEEKRASSTSASRRASR